MKLYREIPVCERLPQFEGIHTVIDEGLNMFQAVYDKEFGFISEFEDCSKIKHWLEAIKIPDLSNDWTDIIDGGINVPDELDPLLNKIGMQMNFVLYSDKNEKLAVCHILRLAEEFFYKQLIEKLILNESN